MLISCASSTSEFVKPAISEELRTACEPLPKLQANEGEDMRKALLQNRAESEAVHESCSKRHKGTLKAVGSSTLQPVARDRWAEFEALLKGQK